MKNLFSFLITALLLAAVSCQQDEFLNEMEDSKLTLKSYVKVDDSRWEITHPDLPWEEWKGMLSLPENWNDLPKRYLIFYAHGMVDPDYPIELPNDLVGGKPVEQIVKDMEMGYATTSYGANGLVADIAVYDIITLLDEVKQIFTDHNNAAQPGYLAPPDYYFLGGPSEGGLVTLLTLENANVDENGENRFDGGLSICGPIGNFYNQLQYNGDFHVLFNYFFEKELKDRFNLDVGNPEDEVNDITIAAWNNGDLQSAVTDLMKKYPWKVTQLLNCAKVKTDMTDQQTMRRTVLECLRFNVKLTNDVITRLTGTPFNNSRKWYWGSYNDWRLNRYVQRVCPDNYDIIKATVKDRYETTGEIEIPLVTLHTTGDHITPYWHQTAYRMKVFLNGNSLLYTGIPVFNYGHCTIEESHLMAAMAILIAKTSFNNLFAVDQSLFSNEQSLESFKQILKDNAVEVQVN
ncbi:hypothetical protein N9164_03990 [Draconibacterium sp.]|nr:hypothetical protein [Draconibacterium sp.]